MMKNFPFRVEISARHVHLSATDFAKLFGSDAVLTVDRPLSVHGEFKSGQSVTIVGPKRSLERVAVLGPFRAQTQVEISVTDSYTLGTPNVPVRLSGDLAGSAAVTLRGSVGEITLPEGLIVARRHVHMTAADREKYGLKIGDQVSLTIGTDRAVTFPNIVVRDGDVDQPIVHLDTDEGNACK